jgi:hypothetical protein
MGHSSSNWRVTLHKNAAGIDSGSVKKNRRQPWGPAMNFYRRNPQIWVRLPPSVQGLWVRGPQRGLPDRLAFAGESSAALPVAFQTELVDHAVQVTGQGGKILERFDGFLGALRIFGRQL